MYQETVNFNLGSWQATVEDARSGNDSGRIYRLAVCLAIHLRLVGQRRPADAFSDEVETDVDMIGDFDEGNAFVHPIVLAIEDHGSFNFAGTRPLPSDDQRQFFRV